MSLQSKAEQNVFWLIVLVLLTVLVGGLVQIVPLFYQKSTTEPVAESGPEPVTHHVRAALHAARRNRKSVQQEDFEIGVPMFSKAIEVNPHPPPWKGMGYFYEHYHFGRYEEALTDARSIEMSGDFRTALFMAAVLGQLGRAEDAAPHLEEMLKYLGRPATELRMELIKRHALSQGLTDHLIEGLAKAGLEGVESGP